MDRRYPVTLTIAGSDSGGGAGIQADLKTFAALGVHGTSVITSLTAQNTRAVEAVHDVPTGFIEAQFEAIHGDFEVKAAKTGMLSTEEIIKTVSREVGNYPLVVDPVMVAESGGRLLKEDAVSVMIKALLPKALVVTPNIHEAEILGRVEIKGIDDMKEACMSISKHGCAVIVKGGHLNATDVLYVDGEFHLLEGDVIKKGTHGSGCAFSAAIAAEIAKGCALVEGVKNAKRFITSAIYLGYAPGKGAGIVNPAGEMLMDSERFATISELSRVVTRLEEEEGFEKLIPEVGMNLAYALPNATRIEDVAGICGRIVKTRRGVKRVGEIAFGCSKHVARVVIAAMKYDPVMRSAMNIRYAPETLAACKQRLEVASFDRENEPQGVSTMEWGTSSAIEACGSVPDAICDEGAIGKEAMIRLFGRDPEEVFEKAVQILREMD